MTEYKDGDKAVIKLVGADEMQELTGRKIETVMGCPILGKLEDFQPAQEKIKMTVEEKKEFDELKNSFLMFLDALNRINVSEYPKLTERLFHNSYTNIDNEKQAEFARYWEHPELIEVIKPEHEFKVGDLVEDSETNEQAVVIEVHKDMSFPVHILYSDGLQSFRKEFQIEFIKSNAINWEDGE